MCLIGCCYKSFIVVHVVWKGGHQGLIAVEGKCFLLRGSEQMKAWLGLVALSPHWLLCRWFSGEKGLLEGLTGCTNGKGLEISLPVPSPPHPALHCWWGNCLQRREDTGPASHSVSVQMLDESPGPGPRLFLTRPQAGGPQGTGVSVYPPGAQLCG